MARFLFVVPPLTGHVNPTVSVGRELARRGHEVAWAGPPGETGRLLPGDLRLFTVGDPSLASAADQQQEEYRRRRHAAALQFLWQDVLIPLAHAMADDLDGVVRQWSPDVIVADQQALAGAAIARKWELPWATSASTPGELADSLASMPRVERWVRDQLEDLQVALGVPAHRRQLGDLRFSEHLVLVFSSVELVGGDRSFPPHYAFVGPAITDRTENQPFPWDWLDPSLPHVLVSLGTNESHGRDHFDHFFAAVTAALADEPLQAILVAPHGLLGEHAAAGNLLTQPQVPQVRLLSRIDAVVTHGGSNTVHEALAHGIPLVVAPVVNDQSIIAGHIDRCGAGIRVRYARVRSSHLQIAVRAVLDQPEYRRQARKVQQSFQEAGGAPEAARRLEELATTTATTTEPEEVDL